MSKSIVTQGEHNMPDIPDWDRTNKSPHDGRFWAECVQDLFQEVMRSLTRTNSNEAPITKAEWLLFNRIRGVADGKYVRESGGQSQLPIDRVHQEGSYSTYIRRWKEQHRKPGEYGRGVSVSGNELYVYTGVYKSSVGGRAPYFEKIDVTKDAGPWNPQVRQMFAEIKSYLGEPVTWSRILHGVGPWAEPDLVKLVQSASKQELLQPALPKPSLSKDQLERARQVVEECRRTGKHTTGQPPKRSWLQNFFG